MRILGIDPGTHRIGWGIIDGNPSEQYLVEAGCIDLKPHTKKSSYLITLHQEISDIIKKYKPDFVGVEKIFFQKNARTAITVAQARGVILLAIAQTHTEFKEFSPNTIKSAVAGTGNANKKQVIQMVSMLLELEQSFKFDDTYDALAVAITTMVYNK